MAYLEAVKRRVPHINAVLLSYADVPHIGALPYLVRKCGMNCPIYATVNKIYVFQIKYFIFKKKTPMAQSVY